MTRLFPLAALLASSLVAPATARTWTDDSGGYTLDAELVAFDEQHAVLKRASDGGLGLVDIARLSADDEAFIAKRRAESLAAGGQQQLWTMRSGLEVLGHVVDYARREVTVQRRRGKTYVNSRSFKNLPAVYKKIVPLAVGELAGNEVKDEATLRAWLVSQKGQPQTFTVDGVVMELADGDEYVIPFFLFSMKDQGVLSAGWDAWLAANGQDDAAYDARAEASMALRARADQRTQLEAEQLRVAKLQLGMAAVNAGVTSLWEVTLYPGPGGGQAQWVVVPGRDSRAAQAAALAQYPGYAIGPVRRVSR